ncbi:hypothetical protein B0H14DRAFT_3177094 [Mycena olivaceomarginata]|nr:hypothetical protein B0H14DRAFT_3177094 [Mycena olivaceomarginata]
MPAINGSVPTPTGAVTRTDTSTSLATTVLLSDASQANIVESGGDVDLGDFFGATPAATPAPESASPAHPPRLADAPTSAAPPSNGPATPVSKGKGKTRNASPGPSVPPLDAAAKQFIDDLNLPEIPPHDKRFDGKNETRGLGVGLHSLAQNTGRLRADFKAFEADSVNSMTGLHAQVLEVDSALGAARAEFNDRYHNLEARLSSVETTELQNTAQLGAVLNTLQTLMDQVSALRAIVEAAAATPSPIPVPTPAPIATQPPTVVQPPVAAPLSSVAPPYSETPFQVLGGVTSAAPAPAPVPAVAPAPVAAPLPPVALVAPSPSSVEGQMERLEALFREAINANKRAHSPSPTDDTRAVRPRVDVSQAYSASASALAPIATPIVQAPALTAATPAPPPAAVQATVAPVPIAPAPALGPVPVSVVTNVANPPPALPPIDPRREARLGPVNWGKNISGESATVIKTVLPAARSIMRNYRARRGPDAHTIIACFESAEIVSWFIPAFNASRIAPYDTVFASPNV